MASRRTTTTRVKTCSDPARTRESGRRPTWGGGPFPVAYPVSWEVEGTLSFTSAPASLPAVLDAVDDALERAHLALPRLALAELRPQPLERFDPGGERGDGLRQQRVALGVLRRGLEPVVGEPARETRLDEGEGPTLRALLERPGAVRLHDPLVRRPRREPRVGDEPGLGEPLSLGGGRRGGRRAVRRGRRARRVAMRRCRRNRRTPSCPPAGRRTAAALPGFGGAVRNGARRSLLTGRAGPAGPGRTSGHVTASDECRHSRSPSPLPPPVATRCGPYGFHPA